MRSDARRQARSSSPSLRPATAGPTGAAGRAARRGGRPRAGAIRTALHASDPDGEDPLAVPHRPQRRRRRSATGGGAALAKLPGVTAVDAGVAYALASTSAADCAAAGQRWQAGLPNQGDGMKIAIIDDGVDQTHPYFSPHGIHDAAGLSEGPDGVHDRQGHRRPRVRAGEHDVAQRAQAVRPRRVGARDARRGHRRRQRGNTRATGTGCPASPPARTSATTRRSPCRPTPASGSTGTHPRSSPRSRLPSPTGWT